MPRSFRSFIFALLLATTALARPGVDPAQWLDRRLLPDERALLARSVGHAPANFGDGIKWLAGGPVSWPELRGKVVILQSYNATDAGRSAMMRISALTNNASKDDLAAVMVHTPEDAAKASAPSKNAAIDFPIAVDTLGHFCDDMGIWKDPVAILIDRQGKVRAAGVASSKLQVAIKALIAEPFDAAAAPPTPVPPRDNAEKPAKTDKKATFPPVTPRGNAVNLIGKKGPPLQAQSWLTPQPDTKGKVVIIDFWATWCGPCRASIPHMNDLAAKFKESVVAVGLSDEDAPVVQEFMKKTKMNYTVATDPGGRMANVTRHKGIPFVIVTSPDGIVRWQGHPMSLDEATLGQIVDASGAAASASPTDSMRWVTTGQD